LLGTVGSLMLLESINAMRRARRTSRPSRKRPGQHNWVHRLPLKMRFKKSKIYLSASSRSSRSASASAS
jgi:hypothetical protein